MFYYIFLLLVLLMPLRNVALKLTQLGGVPGLNVTNILYAIVLLGIFINAEESRQDSYRSKATLPLILYVFYFLLQALLQPGWYAYSELLRWWKDSYLFMLIPYFFVVRTLREPKKIFWLLLVMCIANLYMDTYFWRWVRWMSFNNFADKMKSVNGTFGDVGGCNEWGAFFSTYTLVLLAVAWRCGHLWINTGLKILAGCNILVLLFTFSRGGYAGFITGLCYLFIKAKKYVLLGLLLSLPLFYTVVLPDAVVERIQMSFQSTDFGEVADQDVESRLVMWSKAVGQWAQSPVWGHGLNSFRYQHWRNPHNQHLNILVQGGLIGYVLFLWLFVAIYRDAGYLVKVGCSPLVRSFATGMCAAILSLFIANFFGDRWSYYVLTGYFWVLNGLVVVLINKSLTVDPETEVVT